MTKPALLEYWMVGNAAFGSVSMYPLRILDVRRYLGL
jgi:hypothetical protein